MSQSADTSISQSDEQRLTELFRERRALGETADSEAKQRLDRKISEIVYQHLHDALRPLFLARYGKQVGYGSASTRFTELLNRFFTKVLDNSPGMFRTATLHDLSNYASKSMRRLMIDHFRRAKHEQTCDDELLTRLIEEQQKKLKADCPDVSYEELVRTIDDWEKSDDECRCQMAQLLSYRYLLDTPQDRTQRDLGVSKRTYYALETKARAELRRALGRVTP